MSPFPGEKERPTRVMAGLAELGEEPELQKLRAAIAVVDQIRPLESRALVTFEPWIKGDQGLVLPPRFPAFSRIVPRDSGTLRGWQEKGVWRQLGMKVGLGPGGLGVKIRFKKPRLVIYLKQSRYARGCLEIVKSREAKGQKEFILTEDQARVLGALTFLDHGGFAHVAEAGLLVGERLASGDVWISTLALPGGVLSELSERGLELPIDEVMEKSLYVVGSVGQSRLREMGEEGIINPFAIIHG